MKFSVSIEKEKSIIKVEFSPEERELLDKKMEKLSLNEAITKMPFGLKESDGISLRYWRNTSNALLNAILRDKVYSLYLVDDINKPIYKDGEFNISIFRVKEEKFQISNSEIISSSDMKKIMNVLKDVYKGILSLYTSYEIVINIENKKED